MSNQYETQSQTQNKPHTLYLQTFDNNINKKTSRQDKKIKFNQVVSAVLIPSIKDMDSELRCKLWWNNVDYIAFTQSANKEITKFLQIHRELNRKDAVRLLYEHSIICYEPYIMSDNGTKNM
jgi:hypothetical protein